MSFLTHLECALCGREFEADRLWNLCPACDKPLLARYDLKAASRVVTPSEIAGREANLWRYRELLPVRDPRHALCLSEGSTPLVTAPVAHCTAGLLAHESCILVPVSSPCG